MKRNRTIALMALTVCLQVMMSAQVRAAIIYQDDFSGSGEALLDGSTPDIYPDGTAWKANPAYGADGAVTTGGDSDAGAWLPFSPEAGNIYTLAIDYEVDGGNNEYWISVGFANGSHMKRRFVQTGVDGYGTFRRLDTQTCDTYTGMGAAGSVHHEELTASGRVNVEIVLDASDLNAANWTMAWTAEDAAGNVFSREPVLAAAGSYGDINFIGFTRRAQMTGQIHSLELSVVPEPATCGLLAIGALGCLRRRRR